MDQFSNIVVGIISAIAVIASAWITANANRKIKEITRPSGGILLVQQLKLFNLIQDHISYVFKNSSADRFLILFARNGKTEFKYATAIYEQHKVSRDAFLSFNASTKYSHFEFDKPYLSMLKEAESKGWVDLIVEEMPDSDLKNVYMSEEIVHARLYFLKRIEEDSQNDLILYCTFASHTEPFNANDIIFMKSAVDSLKSILSTNPII